MTSKAIQANSLRRRRYNRRLVLAGAGASALAALGVACGDSNGPGAAQSPSGSKAADRKKITVVDAFEPANYFDAGGGLYAIREGVAEGLVRVSFDTKLEGALASQWEQPDPTTWHATLRQGVVFQDGQPLTPDVAAFSLERLAEANWAPGGFGGAQVTAEPDGITIKTADPVPFMPAILADGTAIVLTPQSFEGDSAATLPVGTGPFKLTLFRPHDHREMTAFDGHWAGAPGVSAVSYLVVPDAQTRVNQVRTGQADINRIVNPPDVPTLQSDKAVNVLTQSLPRFRGLFLNTQKPPLNDPRVRQALAAAVDRKAIVDSVLEGLSEVQTALFRQDFPWANPAFAGIGEDPATAKSLLAAAGYTDDRPLAFELWTYSSRPELPDIAQVIQQQLAAVGVKVNVQVRDIAVMEQEAFAGRVDMTLVGRNPLFLLDPQSFYESDFLSTGSYNFARYGALDAEIKAAATIIDTDARYDRYRAFEQRIINEDAAVIVLNSYLQIDATAANISGYRPHPTDAIALTPAIAKQ